MSLKETLKQESRREREKLKQMTPRDKVWYIWEYYKVHIFIFIGLVLLLQLIATILYNQTFTSRFSYVVINNQNSMETSFDAFNEEFKQYMGYGKKDTIEADGSVVIQYGEHVSEMEYGNMAKISALVAGQSLDAMICDQINIDHYCQLNGFLDLSEVLPADLWEQVKPLAYYGKNEAGESIPCAIELGGTSFMEKTGVQLDPCYFGIITNTARIDTAISWLRFVLDPDSPGPGTQNQD